MTKESLLEASPLRFTDLNSYVAQLRQPINKTSACISISHTLISLAKKKNTPVRINLSLTVNLDKTGEIGSEHKCYLSEYGGDGWHRLKDLNIGLNSIIPLVDEMIDAMEQNGWGCMVDSGEQLRRHMFECVERNRNYVMKRCKDLDVTAKISVNVFLIVDLCEMVVRKTKPRPSILARVSVKIDKESPVESAQFIYFTRKPIATEKPTT
jgi:hypothetical protein